MDQIDARSAARSLGGALEPVIGQVYFSPEAHQAYRDLGFDPSPVRPGGVAWPEATSYATSRGSLMGQVAGTVVAAAFAVFQPEVITQQVERGWTITDAASIRTARSQGALDQLSRVLGQPDTLDRATELLDRAAGAVNLTGRPLAAGVAAHPDPEHPWGPLFRRGDLLREYRGDSHTIAWVDAGLDGIEIGLLTELYWGLPSRSYARTRAWTDDEFDAAEDRLRTRNLIGRDGTFTDEGRALRERIEINTDRQCAPLIDALDDELDELLSLLRPWGAAIRAADGYPASGPHELADRGTARPR